MHVTSNCCSVVKAINIFAFFRSGNELLNCIENLCNIIIVVQ